MTDTLRISETAQRASFLTDNSHFIQICESFNKNLSKVKTNKAVEDEYFSVLNNERERIRFFEKFFTWVPINSAFVSRLEKGESVSENLREEGNAEFRKGRLLVALRCYNLAISFAPVESLALGLGYSNRSALFLKIGEWKLALQDIQRVRSVSTYAGISQDIKNKLKLREAKSNEMISKEEPVSWEGQLLNEKLRQVSNPSDNLIGAENSVAMKVDKTTGRNLVATAEISTGSLILRDLPFFVLPEKILTWETEFCSTCLSPLLGGIPHPLSTFPLFCDDKCLSTWKMVPHEVLAYLHQTTALRDYLLPLAVALNSSCDKLESEASSLEGQPYDPSSFKATLNLVSHRQPFKFNSPELPNEFKAIFLSRLVKEISPGVSVDTAILLRLMENLPYNAINLFCYRSEPHLGFHTNHYKSLSPVESSRPGAVAPPMQRVPYACGVFNLVALCNNSCDPNAVFYKNVRSSEALLLSSRRIHKGEEIHISYKSHWSRMEFAERQEWLEKHYNFQCGCEPCRLRLGGQGDLKDELPEGEGGDEKLVRNLQGIHDDLEEVVELIQKKEWREAWKYCVESVEILSSPGVNRQWRLKVIAEDLLRQIVVQLDML